MHAIAIVKAEACSKLGDHDAPMTEHGSTPHLKQLVIRVTLPNADVYVRCGGDSPNLVPNSYARCGVAGCVASHGHGRGGRESARAIDENGYSRGFAMM
jgi:hypothetical protein